MWVLITTYLTMKKRINFFLSICFACLLSSFNLYASQYCQTPILSTDGSTSINLTCQSLGGNQYEFKVESSTDMQGFNSGTLYMHINGTETYNFSQYLVLSADKRTLSTVITSTTLPSIYAGIMFINFTGEKQFNLPGDIDWSNSCTSTVDEEAPTMETVSVVGTPSYNSADLILTATDNVTSPVTQFIVNDIANSIVNLVLVTDASGHVTLSNLSESTTYHLTITAKDDAGNISENYTALTFTTAVNVNTACSGTSTLASQNSFSVGYTYNFSTSGSDVTVTFELLDQKNGVVAYAWTYNPSFAEVAMSLVSGKKFTKTFSGQTLGETFKVACKFAYEGGMAVTQEFEYTIGDDCAGSTITSDTLAPTNLTTDIKKINSNNIVFTLSSQDQSPVYYVIYNNQGDSLSFGPFTADGTPTTVRYTGLTPLTNYIFSPIIAKDTAGNRTTLESAIMVSTAESSNCFGEGNEFVLFTPSASVNPSDHFSFYYRIETFENDDSTALAVDSIRISCEFLDEELPPNLQFVPQINFLYPNTLVGYRDMVKISSDSTDFRYKLIIPDTTRLDAPINKGDSIHFNFYYAWGSGGLSRTYDINYVTSYGCAQDEYNDYVIDSTEVKSLTVKTTFRANLIIRSGEESTGVLKNLNTTMVSQNIKLEKSVKAGKWYFISFPYNIKVTDIRDYSLGTEEMLHGTYGDDWMVAYFDAQSRDTRGVATGNWKVLPSDSILRRGTGYIFAYDTNAVVRFPSSEVGLTLTGGNQSIENNLPDYSTNLKNWHHNWHLIGQPFFSPLEASALAGPNYLTVYQYPTDSYLNYEKSDYPMKPFSSVFVQYQGDVNYLASSNVLSAMQAPAIIRNKYKLELNNGTYSDYTQINLNENGSTDYVIGADLLKMLTLGNYAPQFYSIDNQHNIKLAFNELHNDETVTVPLGTYFPTSGNYTISLKTDVEAQQVLLMDNVTQQSVDLKINPCYSFTSNKGTNNTRFSLVIIQAPQTVTAINELEQSLLIVAQNGNLSVYNTPSNSLINLYDALGKAILLSASPDETSHFTISNLKKGIYILQVMCGTQKTAYKVVM